MNKKYLSVVLFGALMLGAAGTFTGCIDNDEPAGIENLRGAKAELLKAKAAVEYAREAYKRAEAAWMQAKAQEQELLNKGIELGNKKIELELKVQEAKTEAEIAYWQSQLEETKAELETNKVKWEAELLQSKQNLALVQQTYENCLAAIEAAKLVLSEEELTILTNAQKRVSDLAGKLATVHEDLVDATNALNAALESTDVDQTQEGIELKIAKAQVELDAANIAVAELEELMAKNIDTFEGWEAEVKDLKEKKAVQDTILAQAAIDLVKIKESQEGKDAAKAVEDAKAAEAKAKENLDKAKDGINTDYVFKYKAFSHTVTSTALKDLLKKANVGDDETTYYDNATGKFSYAEGTYTQKKYIDDKGIIPETALAEMLNLVDALTGHSEEDFAWVNYRKDQANKDLTAANTAHDKAVNAWEKAVLDYKEYGNGTIYSLEQYNIDRDKMKAVLEKIADDMYPSTDLQDAAYAEYIAYRDKMTANGQENRGDMSGVTSYDKLKDALNNATGTGVSDKVENYLPLAWKNFNALDNLTAASLVAFGSEMYMADDGTKPRLTLPSPAEESAQIERINKGETNYGDYGTLGRIWSVKAEIAECDDILNEAEAIKALEATLTAQQTAVNEMVAANTAKIKALENAYNDAVAARKAAEKANDALYAEVNKISADAAALQAYYDAIINEIEKQMGLIAEGETTVAGVKIALAEQLNTAKEAVIEAQYKLKDAQTELEHFLAGNYDKKYEIEKLQAELERAQARFDEAQAIYKIALEDLNALIAKFTAASEQPAA